MRLRVLVLAGALLVVPLLLAGRAHASNPQIAGLQVALRAYGLYLQPVDGIAGPATRDATRAFQRRHGLTPDGIAGPRTRAALGPLGHPLFGRRHLVRGDFGWDVSVLQFLLHMPAIDGYLGPTTERALRRWQRHARLVPDGIAGPATLTAFRRRTGVPLPLTPERKAIRRVVVPAENPATVRATLDHWAGPLRAGSEPRPCARLDGVGLQPEPDLVGRRLGGDADPADHVDLRRDEPDRPPGAAHRRGQRPRRHRAPPPPAEGLRRERDARARRLVPGRARGPHERPLPRDEELRRERARAQERRPL